MGVTRRGVLAGSTLALAAAPAIGRAVEAPRFGPPADSAHLLYNENPYGPAPSAVRAMADVAARGCYYVDDVEPRLAAMIAARHGLKPDSVLLGNGSYEVLVAAIMAWSREGSIVRPDLMFDEPLLFAADKGVKQVEVPLAADMAIDLDALGAAAGPGTGMIYICNPNNPTGMTLDAGRLRGWVQEASRKATVLVDEAYMELTDDPVGNSMVDLVRAGQNVIVTRTFSKIYGMAGLRVGYALAPAEHIRRLRGWRPTIGVNSAGLAAALASYDDTAFLRFSREKIHTGRAMLLAAVKQAGLRALPSQTNFVFVEVPDADALQKAMAARGVMIRGAYGKWKHWSRVSCGKLEHVQRYAEALPALAKA